MHSLTATETAILDFERHWWKFPGAKDQHIRERFGISATRYYQLLDALLDDAAAEQEWPTVVRRLRRVREGRRRVRSA